MNQKVTVRIVGGLIAVVALIGGWTWFNAWSLDPENEAAGKTGGMIAALEVKGNASQAVVFVPGGDKKKSPDLASGQDDRELNWGSTGAQVFMSSSRGKDRSYNIYRWNPIDGSFSKRSRGTRSQNVPWFLPDRTVDSLRSGLMVAGGSVQILDPKMMTQRQVLPPLTRNQDSEEGGGSVGGMGIYKELGDSFRDARWGPRREIIYSVLRREGGEILVGSPMAPDAKGMLPKPIPICAGRKVSIDSDASGKLAVLIEDFQWPDQGHIPEEYVKGGKVTTPYRDGLFVIPAAGQGQNAQLMPIVIFPQKEGIYGSELSLSPDGSRVVVVMRMRQGESFKPLGLFAFPAEPGGAAKGGGGLLPGPISSPSWSPDGKKVAYLKLQDGKNLIFTFDLESRLEQRISDEGSSYRSPRFSPIPEAK